MTDLASTLHTIQVEETEYRASSGNDVYTRVGETVNFFLDNIPQSVGELQWSVLTESQFQALRGTNWILCDGRDVTGSDYETLTGNSVVPNAMGKFLRGTDNGAGIDTGRVLGTSQDDSNESHNHGFGYNTSASVAVGANQFVASKDTSFPSDFTLLTRNGGTHNAGNSETVGEDFRPVNTCSNLFIKVNIES